jgi:hypothetical protein
MCVAPLLAQDKFPFSGEWTLNRQASTVSSGMAGVQSGVLRVEHQEPTIRIHLTLVVDGKPFDTSYERPSDGREITETKQGRTTVSSIHWMADSLVFSARAKSGDVEGSIVVRYELQADGRRLRAVEKIRGGGRDQDNTWIFDRK